ncbi:threonine synthase [Streptomyces sp. ME03-5709C]|nr:threonine synthase [Streptomyces sp. ME03-5709C]
MTASTPGQPPDAGQARSLLRGLRCDDCGREVPTDQPQTLCPHCEGLLEFHYDLGGDARATVLRAAGTRRGLWRWSPLLPVDPSTAPVTLGEGDSPLLEMPALGASLGVPGLRVKNDAMMPTGSFKDRGFAVAVTAARAQGMRDGFTYSSGNAGASFAAYAARAGLRATVFVEAAANETKVAAISLLGARVYRLHYDSSDEIFAALQSMARRGAHSFVNFINPVRHEAMKTYAYEICEELGWEVPDVMVHPVGTGGGLWGAWKGFLELRELGLIDRVPRMIGVQPAVCAPLVEAFDNGRAGAVRSGDANATIAQSIAGDSLIQGGRRLLRAIRDSGGAAVAVSEDEIAEAVRALGRHAVAAEPSAAASLAGVAAARRSGVIGPHDHVVAVVTGSALKQPAAMQRLAPAPLGDVRADADDWAGLLAQPHQDAEWGDA